MTEGNLGSGSSTADDVVPAMRPRLPSAERLLPYLRQIDVARTYTNYGPLERSLTARLEAGFGSVAGTIACASSGTAALIGAIFGVAGRPSKERRLAIVPAFTFTATASAVLACGYEPYLCDVDAHTWGLDPEKLLGHPALARTGLVVVVAPYGRAVEQAPWLAFQRRTGIPVVVDGAASFEALSDEPSKFVGDLPVALSFHATKTFSTGEGGCAVAQQTATVAAIARALNFGFDGSRESQAFNINGKLSEYHAAVGLAELDGFAEKRSALEAVAQRYRDVFAAEGVPTAPVAAPDIASCYVLFRCVDAGHTSALGERLRALRIESRLWYGMGLHHHAIYRDVERDDLPTTEELGATLLGLPAFDDLSGETLRAIAAAVR